MNTTLGDGIEKITRKDGGGLVVRASDIIGDSSGEGLEWVKQADMNGAGDFVLHSVKEVNDDYGNGRVLEIEVGEGESGLPDRRFTTYSNVVKEAVDGLVAAEALPITARIEMRKSAAGRDYYVLL
jgi:hypothetical protein